MRQFIILCMFLGVTLGVTAQPEARRKQKQQQTQKSNADNVTLRAQLFFPTSQPMDEDVVWRRDIYRELNLNDDANAGLYYPVGPIDGQTNLFTRIFRLMMTGKLAVYQYRIDGNESFAASDRVSPKAFLDNYHIYYEKQENGKIKLDNSDIPSSEVKAYYIKETSYFDQRTATFHTKVLALCPIMMREDDFGDGGTKYPLFWVRYDDLAPYLAKQFVMTSNLNNAATMSVNDYFVTNQYRGKIYKTNNMLGKTLSQYCPTDSAMAKEQKRIEKELADFEKNIWGNQTRKDSLDSIAKNSDIEKSLGKTRRSSTATRGKKTARVKNRRAKSDSSVSGNTARVTVRRERH